MKPQIKLILTLSLSLTGISSAQNFVQWDMSSAAASTNTQIASGLNITTGAGLSASYSGGVATFTHNSSLQNLADAQAANAYIDFTINVAAWDATGCTLSTNNTFLQRVLNPDLFTLTSTTISGTDLSAQINQASGTVGYGNVGGNASTLGGPTITGVGTGGVYNYRLFVYDSPLGPWTPGTTEINNFSITFNGAADHACAQVVPEPSSMALLGLGSLGLLLRRKRS